MKIETRRLRRGEMKNQDEEINDTRDASILPYVRSSPSSLIIYSIYSLRYEVIASSMNPNIVEVPIFHEFGRANLGKYDATKPILKTAQAQRIHSS